MKSEPSESFQELVILNFPVDGLIFVYIGFDLVFDGKIIIHAKASHQFQILQVVLEYPLFPHAL